MARSCPTHSALLLACIAALSVAAPLGAEPMPPRIVVEAGAGPGYASLLVDSLPRGALMRMDGLAYGRTPVLLERVAPGPHLIQLSLAGHRDRELLIIAAERSAMEVELTLEAMNGWVQIMVEPEDAILEFDGDGRARNSGLIELPVGPHSLEIRRFGYISERSVVTVREDELTRHSASLAPSPFSLSELRVSRSAFNPGNSGSLGSTEISFRVSSFGQARLEILDSAGMLLFSRQFEAFDRERQALLWSGEGADGALSDGTYRVRLLVAVDPGIELSDPSDDLERSALVRIDSSLSILPRVIGAAGPGLALMLEPFADPPGTARVELGARFDPETLADPALVASLAYEGKHLGLALRAVSGNAGEDWQIQTFGSMALVPATSRWGAALYLGAGAGSGAEASAIWLGDSDAKGVSGGTSLGLAVVLGRKQAWLGLAPELGMGLAQGRFCGSATLRAGASLGASSWRLGISSEARARLESGDLSVDAPRLALEAHAFLAPAPLSLSLVGTFDLGEGFQPERLSLSLLAGLTL